MEDLRLWAGAMCEPQIWRREMGGAESMLRPRVFRIAYPQLGDHWVALCHYIRLRRHSGLPHRLNAEPVGFFTRADRESLISEIAAVLGVGEHLEFTDDAPEVQLPVHPARHGETLLAPSLRMQSRHWVAFQFDGISHPKRNPTTEDMEAFLSLFDSSQLRRVGRPLTLAQSMEVLLQSKLFIGVSSGMSHLAASAGTPAFIYNKAARVIDAETFETYRQLRRWHPYAGTKIFSSREELVALLSAEPNSVPPVSLQRPVHSVRVL